MKSFFNKTKDYFIKTDKLLWILTITSLIFGLILINSMQRSTEYNLVNTQIIAIIIGIITAVVISCINYSHLLRLWPLFAAISIGLLITVFAFGMRVSGTDDTAWIRIGPVSVQPSEFVKVFFIITFAKHLDYLKENDKLNTLLGFISLLIHAFIPIAIIHLQGEDGTVLIFIFMVIIMMFLGEVPLKYFIIMLLVIVAAVPIIWNYFLGEEQKNRFMAIFDLEGSSMIDYGWQQYQGKVSIASGGLNGSGLGRGERVSSYIVPEQENDFILTVAGEELGFLGCIAIIGILLAIIIKILFNAYKSRDYAGKTICVGVFSMISSQCIINIGMVLGLLPVVGITLPFFSSGGTSILSIMISIGLVQSVYLHKGDIEEPEGLLRDNKYKYMPNKNNIY